MSEKMLNKEEFFKALRAAREPVHSGGHPFSNAWKNGELTRDQLGEWATQQYYYINIVAQMFAALYARLPDLDARQHMLENMVGEETPGQRHPDVLLKFAKACGRDPERIKNAYMNGEVFPATLGMQAWVWQLSTHAHLCESAAGIMVALEGQTPTIYPPYIEAGLKMGFSDDDLEFFHIHVEADIEHEMHGLEICNRYATTADLQRRAIATVTNSGGMRYNMLTSIWNTFQLDQAAE